MGAIYGLVGRTDLKLLSAMGDRLAHRGLTRSEVDAAVGVGLGQRSHKPTVTPTRSEGVTVVADADIYNVPELCDIFAGRGLCLPTDQVQEIILRGYREFGPRLCEYINGDFAFALWDAARSALILARDIVGSRPLYYWQDGETIAFSSEYKALLALSFVPSSPDLEAIQHLQHTKYPPNNRTLLRGIFSVPPGHFMEFRSAGHTQQRYWNLALDPVAKSVAEESARVRRQFLSAVEKRISDVEYPAVSLSGGIDSAAVVAAVRELRPDAVLHTFTGVCGATDPEMNAAALTSEVFGTIHHPVHITGVDLPRLIPRIVWHLEDPIARTEVVPIFEVARVASQFTDVVLAGYLADGLYGGMPRHRLVRLIQSCPPLSTPLAEFYNYTQSSTRPQSMLGKALHWAYYRGSDAKAPTVLGAAPSAGSLSSLAPQPELLNHVLRDGIVDGTAKWLPKADRLHLAHGLTFRSPFMDPDLIAGAFRITDRLKVRGRRDKFIFRAAMEPLVPQEILNRPKFPQAMVYDIEMSKALEEMSARVLCPAAVRSRGFFATSQIDQLRRRIEGRPYAREQADRLWTALLTEIWAQLFLDQRGMPFPVGASTAEDDRDRAV